MDRNLMSKSNEFAGITSHPSSTSVLDYFWIAGVDGQELLDSYVPLRIDGDPSDEHGISKTIQEESYAEKDSWVSDPPVSPSHYPGSPVRNSFQRLYRVSDEARFSVQSLDAVQIGSNRSSATIRVVPSRLSTLSTLSTALSEADFDKALAKFANNRDKFFLDLNFKTMPSNQISEAKPRAKTQKIVPEELQPSPSRGLSSIRRHISFKEMSSVKRQPSLARNVSVKTSRRMSSYNSVIPMPEALNESSNLHPLKRKFEPVLLDRYPRKGTPDELKRQFSFPEYVPMFAFPNDVQVVAADSRPRSTWHGFSMTAADNSRLYALCIILWTPMNRRTADVLEKRCEEWRRANMTEAERELAVSLVDRLAFQRAKLSQLLASLAHIPSGTRAREDLEESISGVEERINLMVDMLKPLRHGAASKIEGLTDGDTGLWTPRAYGILDRDGSKLSFWKEWLRAIAVPMSDGAILRIPPSSPKVGMWHPLERYIYNACVEASGPSSSKTQTEINIRELRIFARKGATNELPGSRDTDLYPLFRALSIPNIMVLFEFVLAEARIILLSSHISMLQLTSKALIELIWPLQWTGVYIPVLPARLIQALEAPCPYICGVERRLEKLDFPDDDFVLVDLDKNEIQSTWTPPVLPKQQRRKLMSLLYLAAPHHSRGVPAAPPLYVVETFPFDAFASESSHVFSPAPPTTNLAKLAGLNSSNFGHQAETDSQRRAPVFNAFIQAGSTRARSLDRPKTASTARNSNAESPRHSPVSASFPPLPATPLSRNDSGYALQSSLREKRSGHFDSVSRRSGSISKHVRREMSSLFVKHAANASASTDLPSGTSTYAPSTYAQSSLAASTLMLGMFNQPTKNSESVNWVEGHCLEWRTSDSQFSCSICDEKVDDGHFRCSGCSITVHARCTFQVILVCPAAFFPDQIRAAFVRSFASLFYTYKKFMVPSKPDQKKRGMARSFNASDFLRSLPQDHAEYIAMLQQTQAFNEFIAEREMNAPAAPLQSSIALFDAIILAKRNRAGRLRSSMPTLSLGRNRTSSRNPADVLSDKSEHIWRTTAAPHNPDRLDFGAAAKGRDYHTIVTRMPAKLEEGLLMEQAKPAQWKGVPNGTSSASTLRRKMNGLSMNAP